jgi:serine protease DegS
MRRFLRALNFLSPWVALGLAAALFLVYRHPGLLGSEPRPPTAAPPATAAAPAATSVATAERAPAEPPAHSGPALSYADAVARAAPAVVNIATRRVVIERQLPQQLAPLFGDVWPEYRQRVDRSLGSGVILDTAGHIATNHHVIKDAQEIEVQLADGRVGPAKLVGSDPDTDLALLKVEMPRLPVMTLGHSDQLRVGDVVLAIGNSLGFGQTVTQGIVSATGRSALGLATFENFIQTDAAINQGNSGGALVTASGELVGINTAVLRGQVGIEGVGFAIPVNLVRGVTAEIEHLGRVIRGWTGIGVASLPADLVDNRGTPVHGVQVRGFYQGSPAPASGLRPGDIIVRLDDASITDTQSFLANIARRKPGTQVKVEALRPGAGRLETSVPIVERPRA